MADPLVDWGASLRQTWRLLPEPGEAVRVLLSSDGETPEQIAAKLPYEASRAGDAAGTTPNLRRYRDERLVLQLVGLVYEDEGHLVVTELGRTVLRWLELLHVGNAPVLGRHAALALAACQLRNPSRAGSKYDDAMKVFPYAFIWRAMLSLDDRISSAELLRSILKVRNETELSTAITAIRAAREADDVTLLGDPINDDNDRAIPWMGLASFGWVLIRDKRAHPSGVYYTVRPSTREALVQAVAVPRVHLEFATARDYLEYISYCAVLPPLVG